MTISHQSTHIEAEAMSSLRRRWGLVVLLYGTVWWITYQVIQSSWHATFANRWRFLSAALALLLLGLLWRWLRHNRRTAASRLWPTLGYGNWLSLARGILLCLLAGFLFLPRPTIALTWLPALLYTADRITDLFDGYLARRTQRESRLGAILDIELDGLGLLIAVVLGVQYGLLPYWYLFLAVSRQLFVAGLWLRQRRGLPNRELPPSDNRRIIAGFQTGFLSVMFWPLLTPAVTHLAAWLFAVPLIYSFGRDWLVVSHVIDPDGGSYLWWRRTMKRGFEQILPLIARLGGCAAMLLLVGAVVQGRLQLFAMPTADLLLLGAALSATVGLLVGCMARLAALCLLAFALWLSDVQDTLTVTTAALMICTIIVAHLGSGAWSRWQPEERWLHTQLG